MGLLFSAEDSHMRAGLDLYNRLLASNNYKEVYISPCNATVQVNIAASLAVNNQSIFTYLISHPQFDPYTMNGMVFVEAAKHNKLAYINKWLHNADIKLVTGCLNDCMTVLSKDMMLTLIPKSNYILEDYANMLLKNNIDTLSEFKYSIWNDVLLHILSSNNHNLLRKILHNLSPDQINTAVIHSIQNSHMDCYDVLIRQSTMKSEDLINIAIQYNNSIVLDKLHSKRQNTVIILE